VIIRWARRTLIGAVCAGMLASAGPAAGATPTVTEIGGPLAGISDTTFQSGIAAAPDGKLWFIEQVHGRIGAIEPFGGTVAEHAAPDGLSGIGVGPDANFYFGISPNSGLAGQSWIGDGKTSSGLLAQQWYGGGSHAEPHFPVAGPEGRMWVTQPGDDTLGLIDLATPPALPSIAGAVGASSGLTAGSDPETIVGGPSDRSSNPSAVLWFTEFAGNRIGRATPVFNAGGGEGAQIDEYSLPISAAKPEGIALGPDGNIWFTEFGKDAVGRLIPPATFAGTPSIQSFPLATGTTPIGIAAGPDGNLWVAETGKSKIARVSTSGVVTGEYPTGPPPVFIAAGADGNLWATETNSTTVARVNTGLDAPQFQSTAPIPIDPGASDPPPTLDVSGLTGTISKVTVRLTGISHNFPDDMDLLLQAPNGQTVAVASDIGSLENTAPKRSWPANGVTLTLDDSASASLSDDGPLVSGIYKPTNEEGNSDSEDGLINVTPVSSNFSSSLASLNGGSPNGAWKLWVIDDTGGDTGTIFGGWGLDIRTTGPPATPAAPLPTAPTSPKCKKPKKKSKKAKKKYKKCLKRLKK
jgi:streptogramin lyase/subtilisin-like proprotein convertase family protein